MSCAETGRELVVVGFSIEITVTGLRTTGTVAILGDELGLKETLLGVMMACNFLVWSANISVWSITM